MKLKFAAVLLALPLLAACAPEIESSIYMQDVAKVASTGESLSVPAVLRVPQSSEEACLKGLAALIEKFKELAPVTSEGKCVEKNTGSSTDQLAEIDTQMVIALPDGGFDAKNLFVLVVEPTDETSYNLSFQLLKPIAEIVKLLAADSNELTADFDPANFIFSLENDMEGDIQLLPNTIFVDGEPGLPELGPRSLARRDHVELVFSDVASAYVEKANSYRFATVTAAQ